MDLQRALEEYYRAQAVWEKGAVDLGRDTLVWRRDCYGNLINRYAHGNRNSEFGWEIDHILPAALGGIDSIFNLRPLHWRANLIKTSPLSQLLR